MHRTEGDGYIEVSGKKYFADEDPPSRDATQLRHQEANAYQEEIAQAIEAEGITLNTGSETYAQMNQLDTAIWQRVAKLSPRMIQGLYPYGYSGGGAFSVFKGSCISRDGSEYMSKTGSDFFNKAGTKPWTAGTGNGGIPTSVTMTQGDWYPVFIIKKISTGAVDFGIDDNVNATNLMTDSGYDVFRLLGFVQCDNSSSPYDFREQTRGHLEQMISLYGDVRDYTSQTLSVGGELRVSCPDTICRVQLYIELWDDVAEAWTARIGTVGLGDLSDDKPIIKVNGASGEIVRLFVEVQTDASGNVDIGYKTGDAGAGNVEANINTLAYSVDTRQVADEPLYIP